MDIKAKICHDLTLVICGIGLVGNVLMLTVLLFQKELRHSTSSNYLLLGLTVSDILLLLKSSLNMFKIMGIIDLDSQESLRVLMFLWDWISTCGTKYFTVAISIERYIAVCHPLKARIWLSNKIVKWACSSIVIFVVLLSIWSFLYERYFWSYGFDIYVGIVVHLLPFIVVLVFNVFIYLGLRKFQKTRLLLTSSEAADVAVTKRLLCVVIVFGVCYSFEFIRRIMSFVGYFDPKTHHSYEYTISYLADIFYVLNSAVNFIIYFFMVEKFRRQFLKVIKC